MTAAATPVASSLHVAVAVVASALDIAVAVLASSAPKVVAPVPLREMGREWEMVREREQERRKIHCDMTKQYQ